MEQRWGSLRVDDFINALARGIDERKTRVMIMEN